VLAAPSSRLAVANKYEQQNTACKGIATSWASIFQSSS
jgi:hypothetical protein